MEEYTTGTGQVIRVHNRGQCFSGASGPCVVHNPTDHRLAHRPTHWRDDRGLMERICEHGIGHPDPDDVKVRIRQSASIHGCDGCCPFPQELD